MNTEKTFVFNGVTYDTDRFLKGQAMFKKITPDNGYIVSPTKPPFISDEIKLPIVLQYEGSMIAVALPANAVGKEATSTEGEIKPVIYRDVRLATKHTLKSYAHQEPVADERVEDLQRHWQPPRRDGFQQRPYQSRNGYSSRRYWYPRGLVAPILNATDYQTLKDRFMSKNANTAAATEELKAIAEHIVSLGDKIIANVEGQENGGIKDHAAETTAGFFTENLPEGVDEKQAKTLLNYIATYSNANDYAASKLGLKHVVANPEAEGFTLKSKMLGRDHVTSKFQKGTSSDTAGMITTDVQHYHVGTNMGQHNLIVKHSNAAAREALKFDWDVNVKDRVLS